MANKIGSGTSWVPSQGDLLMESTKAAYNALNEKYEEVQAIFNQIRGEEIIGESTSKDKLLEVMASLDAAFNTLNEKLVNVNTTMEQIFEAVTASTNTNESTTAEAGESVNSAAKRAEDTTGSNAQ